MPTSLIDPASGTGSTFFWFFSDPFPPIFQPNEAVARALLQCGAQTDACDSSGSTPLLLCAGQKSSSLAVLLLESGSDINAVRTQRSAHQWRLHAPGLCLPPLTLPLAPALPPLSPLAFDSR